MKPGVHYDRDQTTAYMDEKTSVKVLLATAAEKQWGVEHFHITSAYFHEKYIPQKTVYIKQHPNFNGSFQHQ